VNPDGAKRIAQAAFRPITWSPKDTAPTVRQIKVHNEVGVELGLWKAPKKKGSWLRRPAKPKVAQAPKPIIVEDPEVWPPIPNVDKTSPPPVSVTKPVKKHWWQIKKPKE
jgi:hypothetical protein